MRYRWCEPNRSEVADHVDALRDPPRGGPVRSRLAGPGVLGESLLVPVHGLRRGEPGPVCLQPLVPHGEDPERTGHRPGVTPILGYTLALLIGLSLGLLGGGGSILTVPVLHYVLGYGVKEAI